MTISDATMIFVVLVAPFSAGWVLWQLQLRHEIRQRKLWIFRTLMATRAARLSLDHVQALNLIELDFSASGREKEVIRAWKEYIDHLRKPQPTISEAERLAFNTKRGDLFMKLLSSMADCVGYDFDVLTLRDHGYLPDGWEYDEWTSRTLRQKCHALLRGDILLQFSTDDGQRGNAQLRPNPQSQPPVSEGP